MPREDSNEVLRETLRQVVSASIENTENATVKGITRGLAPRAIEIVNIANASNVTSQQSQRLIGALKGRVTATEKKERQEQKQALVDEVLHIIKEEAQKLLGVKTEEPQDSDVNIVTDDHVLGDVPDVSNPKDSSIQVLGEGDDGFWDAVATEVPNFKPKEASGGKGPQRRKA